MSASTVRFKFKNTRDAAMVTFDGPYISLAELKRQINKQSFGRISTSDDLVITNEQTNEGAAPKQHAGHPFCPAPLTA